MTSSTVDDVDPQTARTAWWIRTVGTVALLGVIGAALLGAFGTRTAEGSATQDGWTVSVRHAAVARAGLDVPVTITVHRAGGFDDDVVVAVTSDYLRFLDQQSTGPEPAEQTRDAEWTYLTFTRPDGDTLTVDIEAYVRALHRTDAAGTVAVVTPEGNLVAPVNIRTRLIP